MKVVILCGGQGTRLREETEYRPKPMVDVGGHPILWHIMRSYAHHGLNEFVLCLGYRGNMIKEYFIDYEAMNSDFTIDLGRKREVTFHDNPDHSDFVVTLADTGLNSMTGSRIKRAARYIDGDTFLVTYGDGVSDVDFGKLLAFHRAHGKLATVTTVRPYSRYGVLEIDGLNNVRAFTEKPQIDGWTSAGFFVFERAVLDYLSVDPECVLERQPLEQLARDKQLVAYQHDGFFFAMDTYREYLYLNELWASGQAPWKVW